MFTVPPICPLRTVMPSLDLRASSMTVVMAFRWGIRHSGLTVDTAEYKLYLQRAAQTKEQLVCFHLKRT